MKVGVIGAGYVGLVAGTCFAETGNDVICIDVDEKKIEDLKKGIIPIYEPGLEEMVKRNFKDGRLQFSTDISYAVKESLILFIAVGTPESVDGSADLKYVLSVASDIGKSMNAFKIIVDKSTVPVGTADLVREEIKKHTHYEFDVVSNPEFLKEGAAIDDFMKPDRVVIGTDNVRTEEIMKELYSPFVRTGKPIIAMDIRSAEMTKYAANAMLATRITFMNEIANLCERVGANVEQIRKGIGSDSRIGNAFLFPGIGYGGSCFPKDVKAIFKTAKEYEYDFKILKAVDEANELQKKVLVEKIVKYFGDDLSGKTFGVWGLAFKPNTDDMREAPSIVIIEELLKKNAGFKVYDPESLDIAKGIFGDKVSYFENNYEVLKDVNALLLLTEWTLFRRPDFDKMKTLMKEHIVFDGRNQYSPEEMKEKGFTYISIGR